MCDTYIRVDSPREAPLVSQRCFIKQKRGGTLEVCNLREVDPRIPPPSACDIRRAVNSIWKKKPLMKWAPRPGWVRGLGLARAQTGPRHLPRPTRLRRRTPSSPVWPSCPRPLPVAPESGWCGFLLKSGRGRPGKSQAPWGALTGDASLTGRPRSPPRRARVPASSCTGRDKGTAPGAGGGVPCPQSGEVRAGGPLHGA